MIQRVAVPLVPGLFYFKGTKDLPFAERFEFTPPEELDAFCKVLKTVPPLD